MVKMSHYRGKSSQNEQCSDTSSISSTDVGSGEIIEEAGTKEGISKTNSHKSYFKLGSQKIQRLRLYYSKNIYPAKREFARIANELEMSTSKVINWFKHRRRSQFKKGVLKRVNEKTFDAAETSEPICFTLKRKTANVNTVKKNLPYYRSIIMVSELEGYPKSQRNVRILVKSTSKQIPSVVCLTNKGISLAENADNNMENCEANSHSDNMEANNTSENASSPQLLVKASHDDECLDNVQSDFHGKYIGNDDRIKNQVVSKNKNGRFITLYDHEIEPQSGVYKSTYLELVPIRTHYAIPNYIPAQSGGYLEGYQCPHSNEYSQAQLYNCPSHFECAGALSSLDYMRPAAPIYFKGYNSDYLNGNYYSDYHQVIPIKFIAPRPSEMDVREMSLAPKYRLF